MRFPKVMQFKTSRSKQEKDLGCIWKCYGNKTGKINDLDCICKANGRCTSKRKKNYSIQSKKIFDSSSCKEFNVNNCGKIKDKGKLMPDALCCGCCGLCQTGSTYDDGCCCEKKLCKISNTLKLLLQKHREYKKQKSGKNSDDGSGICCPSSCCPRCHQGCFPFHPLYRFSPFSHGYSSCFLPYYPPPLPPYCPSHSLEKAPFPPHCLPPQKPLSPPSSDPKVSRVCLHINDNQPYNIQISHKHSCVEPVQRNISVISVGEPPSEAAKSSEKIETMHDQVRKCECHNENDLTGKNHLKTDRTVSRKEEHFTNKFSNKKFIDFEEKKKRCHKKKKCASKSGKSYYNIIYKKRCKKKYKPIKDKKSKSCCSKKNYCANNASIKQNSQQACLMKVNKKKNFDEKLIIFQKRNSQINQKFPNLKWKSFKRWFQKTESDNTNL